MGRVRSTELCAPPVRITSQVIGPGVGVESVGAFPVPTSPLFPALSRLLITPDGDESGFGL